MLGAGGRQQQQQQRMPVGVEKWCRGEKIKIRMVQFERGKRGGRRKQREGRWTSENYNLLVHSKFIATFFGGGEFHQFIILYLIRGSLTLIVQYGGGGLHLSGGGGGHVYTGSSGGTYTMSATGNRQYVGGNGYGHR